MMAKQTEEAKKDLNQTCSTTNQETKSCGCG